VIILYFKTNYILTCNQSHIELKRTYTYFTNNLHLSEHKPVLFCATIYIMFTPTELFTNIYL